MFMPSVFIKTYGCQMNERDSEQVARTFVERGYTLTDDEVTADVVLLNTCSVRDMAEQKAIGKMGMLNRKGRHKPNAIFGYLGCMAQSRGAELLEQNPRVDLVVGTQKFHRTADYVDEILKRRREARMDDERFTIVDVEEEVESQNTIKDHILAKKQSTAFVSIMQGCNMHCTFCIVPSTRGPERSRPIEEIVAEVTNLVATGVREVTLLGQIVNLYGRHELPKKDGKSPFVQLLEAIHAIEGLDRLRFTSPHPMGFRDDLVQAFAELPKLMEHVHLPLQSGSNRILKAMHRPYTAERYLDLIEKLRRARPGIAITTDIIVGFPDETEEDYAATRKLAETVEFDNAFVFRYSQRRDTPAAEMTGQLSEEVKESRNQDLLNVINASAKRKLEAFVGKNVEILCEGPSKTNPNRLSGRTRDNKIVIFDGAERHTGQIFQLRIQKAHGFSLFGDPAILN
ncbi:MAG: tRNA (N6-isopentenyl adenosine(37)-C2)-methylthiotransferase MiaB [Chthoniobacterales bacterium]